MIRYHLDENVHHAIARGLRLRGVDVTTSTDAGLVEADDEAQLEFAMAEGRVFFTHDSDFLKPDYADRDHAGIVYSPKDRRTIGDVIRYLSLIAETLDTDEMKRRIEYI